MYSPDSIDVYWFNECTPQRQLQNTRALPTREEEHEEYEDDCRFGRHIPVDNLQTTAGTTELEQGCVLGWKALPLALQATLGKAGKVTKSPVHFAQNRIDPVDGEAY